MNPLKKLAGQTAIYGLSTILARILNFFMVPLYTRVLTEGAYGLASEILAYIALLQVVLTFGLETGFFRFAGKNKEKASEIFSTALITLATSSFLFLAFIIFFANKISLFTGHPAAYVIFSGIILAMDCFTAILFAKLRQENKALKFVIFRTVKIVSEIVFNLLFFFVMPHFFVKHPHSVLLNFVSPTPDYGYMFFAIMLSAIVSLLLFLPELLKTKYVFSKKILHQLFVYSLPLMIAGLPGVANDFASRIFFRFFAPPTPSWQAQLGIFNANIKLAVFLVLFVQMFRYAAEPFFFSNAQKEGMKTLYARVMRYFVAFCLVIALGIAFYMDLFALILGKNFRSGINVLPIMLLANVLLGVNFNLSMWYKLSEKTRFAIYITLSGLVVNVIVNILFMPTFGAMAAAWGFLLSYLTMVILSNALSRKYYPIPYDWKTICYYFAIAITLYLVSHIIVLPHAWMKYALNTIFFITFVFIMMKMEHVTIKQLRSLVAFRK